MSEYHYKKDSISKLGKLYQLKPEVLQAFMDFDGKVFSEGALSIKVKELIAIACAHVTQKKAGAEEAEIAEAIFVAASLRAGGALAHSCIAIESLEEK
jgi:alkylhydroperoxidase/carboxymuconolactone decarboxylase family protein YurZ